MDYTARYTESLGSNTIQLILDATSDAESVAEINAIVASGFRNETHANVDLSDGRTYGAKNEHGEARGGYI